MRGIGVVQDADDCVLGPAVGLGDGVVAALVLDPFEAAEKAAVHGRRGMRGTKGGHCDRGECGHNRFFSFDVKE
jgi:hypothetical protein